MAMSKIEIGVGITVVMLMLMSPLPSLAHRSGCHTLHTCPSDSTTYVCGDLGYQCDGTSSVKDVVPGSVNVPLLVEATFGKIFGRAPLVDESVFWKQRFRADKSTIAKIRAAMRWHKANDSFGPKVIAVKANSEFDLIVKINSFFRSVYAGRNPSVSENRYWITRVIDKPFEAALIGAMAWHRDRGIEH